MSATVRLAASPFGETVYWPEGRAPRGGVVCLHGSDGAYAGWNDVNCALLAANGFVALAHGYSQGHRAGHTPDIDAAPLDGAEAALLFLMDELAPWSGGVGLFGYSKGAEHAHLLAQLLAEDGSRAVPRAVATHAPQDAVWPAFILSGFETGRPWRNHMESSAGSLRLPKVVSSHWSYPAPDLPVRARCGRPRDLTGFSEPDTARPADLSTMG